MNLVVSTLQGGGKRGHRIDAESAAGGHLVISPTLTASMGVNAAAPGHGGKDEMVLAIISATGPTTHTLTSEGADASEDGTGRGTPIVAALTTRCGNTQDDQQTGQLVAQATAVRRLTPRECERLQGFPDDWTATSNGKPQADSARYRQMGNAVAVPCVEWIAKRIAAVA